MIKPMDDSISRQAAIDAVKKAYENDEMFDGYEYRLQELPSAQPERKKGRWIIEYLCSTSGGTYQVLRCSICKHLEQPWQLDRNFCPNCGADMIEESEGTP